MSPATLERVSNNEDEEVADSSGLLGGLEAKHFRRLCESPMNGGGGFLPSDVGNMSLDQIWFLLCNIEELQRGNGTKVEKLGSLSALGALKPDEKGLYRGVTKDGKQIKGRIGGTSLARQLMEKEEARKQKELRKEKRRKRRQRKK